MGDVEGILAEAMRRIGRTPKERLAWIVAQASQSTGTLVLLPPAWASRENKFSIENEAGHKVHGGSFYDASPWAVRLTPGQYTLKLSGPDGETDEERQIVVGTEPLRVDLGS